MRDIKILKLKILKFQEDFSLIKGPFTTLHVQDVMLSSFYILNGSVLTTFLLDFSKELISLSPLSR